MRVCIVETPQRIGEVSADWIQQLVAENSRLVLGVATGSSPVTIYEQLASRRADGQIDLSEVTGFALDEYVGLPTAHEQSYAHFVAEHVEKPLGMRPGAIRVPDGLADDLRAAASEFEDAIARAGGIGLQILGVGTNGHVGFNEPSSSLGSRTRVKTLAAQTLADNARFFADPSEVPRLCVTQGLGTILEAKRVLLVASGASKAAAVAAIVEGPVSAMWPGSVLQHHPDTTVVIDEAAAANLTLTDYYRSTPFPER